MGMLDFGTGRGATVNGLVARRNTVVYVFGAEPIDAKQVRVRVSASTNVKNAVTETWCSEVVTGQLAKFAGRLNDTDYIKVRVTQSDKGRKAWSLQPATS